MIKKIQELYEKKINETFRDSPLVRHYLLTHERREVLFKNLLGEINKLEHAMLRFDILALEEVVNSLTLMFAKAAILNKEQDLISNAEKNRQIAEYEADQAYIKELDNDSSTAVDELNAKAK